MKQHRTAISIVSLATIICLGYGASKLLGGSHIQVTDDAYIRADSVMVSPRVSAQILKVLVEDNQTVVAGQILAEIDDSDYLVAKASEHANVEAAESELLNLAAGIERQSAVIDQASATIRATTASLRFAEENAKRYKNLSSAGAGTQQERQKAEADLESWRAAVDRDTASKFAASKALHVLKAQLEVAKSVLDKNRAALRQAELNLSYTKIKAPFDGMVGRRSVRVGANVSPGQTLLAVVPVKEAFVIANFRETQLAHMTAKQRVTLHVDSFPDHDFVGRIESVSPATGASFSEIAPDNATGNFTKIVQRLPVKIVFDDDQPNLERLRVGMSVVASVDTSKVD
ncbi:secretion protein [Pseudomonas putida]|uniref:HlyD family secretion protein n=1 Tax=Pseudomonas putida TaxID=303 RepID=UPI000E0DF957|nr:HlyD family secretion protein [Pseudomonas putida]WQE52188.1 HlyD family secretion protein [Pseudomonas putida]GLO05677.1 secretion protein [Pseudomonas putida]HDS1009106.1 HlyD family secretion protein [Pseudomonas putida]